MDNFLIQLVPSAKVDVMPGKNDPSPNALPMLQLSPLLVRQSSKYSSLCLSPNPHAFTLDKLLYDTYNLTYF